MNKKCSMRFVLPFAVCLPPMMGTAAAIDLTRPELALQERLGQKYGREALAYRLEAPRGACQADSLTLSGPDGQEPLQLSEIVCWDDDGQSLKSALLTFVAPRLDPLELRAYRLATGKPAAGPTDLAVKNAAGADSVIEMATAAAGVRVLAGPGALPQPLPLRDLPAPIAGMRLGGAAWQGGLDLAGDALVSAWQARLTGAGPVFGRIEITYTFAEGDSATLAITLFNGDNSLRWDLACEQDRPDAALLLNLPPLPGITTRVQPAGRGIWARDRSFPVEPGSAPLCSLGPDGSVVNIFAECPPYLVFSNNTGRTLNIFSRHPEKWVEPAPRCTYGGFARWNNGMIEPMWENWRRKVMPVTCAADGTVGLRATLARGGRSWLTAAGAPVVGESLDKAKELVLDWPANPARPHPRGFMDAQTIDAARKRIAADPEAARIAGSAAFRMLVSPADKQAEAAAPLLKRLREQLGQLGGYDTLRQAIAVITLYDLLIDSGHVTPEERSLLRAQAAYLGYFMADPATWSPERGFCSGNPNMSCSYILSLGVIATVLQDHPQAKEWADYATSWLNHWLDTEVGANGEWLPEGSHYGFVSLEPMLAYAIAAQCAGFADFTNDPRLKRLLLYFAKYHTPRDPQRNNLRVSGAYGRGTSGDTLGVFGLAAAMNHGQDAEFSSTMQWMWREMGCTTAIGDSRLGGFEPFYMDRTLPAAAPQWASELFPQLGALLRSAFNTPHESYVNFLAAVQSKDNLDIWTPGVGGISQWFGRGAPLSTCFTSDNGYSVRHELLRDGVRLARNWGAPDDPKNPFGYYTETLFDRFSSFADVDYVRTTITNTTPDDRGWFPSDHVPAFPRVKAAQGSNLEWTRQALFLRDADPAGPAYLVLRDTVSGGQPTAWQFWTLSAKLGGAGEAQKLETFLADAPGNKAVDARLLPGGERYTALGLNGMDVEYFVAAPRNTPRHTLRYGGVWLKVYDYQDMLHLQLPGDGAYFVAIFPRPRAETPPAFSRFGENIIRVSGAFGTDYAFLAQAATTAKGGDARFTGTAAAIQERNGRLTLSLGAPGEAGYKGYGIRAPLAVSATVVGPDVSIAAMTPHEACKVEFTAPRHGTQTIDLPANAATAALVLGTR